MKLVIAAVGKLKAGAERELFAHYLARSTALSRALHIGPISTVEIPESRAPDAAARRTAEGEALRARIAAGMQTIALDRSGDAIGSQDMADMLRGHQEQGCRALAFLIGGPDGHEPATLARSGRAISLGGITLPHGLARIVLAEQLYRALTILAGHPYHRA